MAVRKTWEETFVVNGSRQAWLARCEDALRSQGFTNVRRNDTLGQIGADYKKFTTYGSLLLTLTPEGGGTRVNARATANVDNIFALFGSPGQTILARFKDGLA